jgi:hypothetical protein
MEPAPGSVTVTMSGATFPGGQGAVGWGRSRQNLAPPVLLGPPADAGLAPSAASPRQNGGALLRGLRPCPRRMAAVRPAPGRNPGRAADTAAVSGSVDAPGLRPGRRSRQTSAVQTYDRGRGLWTPAARRRPAPVDTRDGGRARGRCGSGRLDSLQRNRPPPLACPAGNRTASCGIGQHRHGQTARSVAWCSASIWSAPDGSACSGWVRRWSRRVQRGPGAATWRAAQPDPHVSDHDRGATKAKTSPASGGVHGLRQLGHRRSAHRR